MALDILLSEIDFMVLLTIAVFIAIVVKNYVKLPYTIALILFGMIIGFFNITHIELTKELIFFFFLPPLLFEGAIHFDVGHLKENFKYIGSLAFLGLLITTFAVGGIVHYFLKIPFLYALLFGAIISPTDPISVLALFKKLGVNKQLTTIIEGESIFNDGTGIVVFTILLTLVETGVFSLVDTVKDFFVISVGGIIIGVALGYLAYQAHKIIEDTTVEVLMTLILAYASFIIAEHYFHVSGVMAVVASGILIGNKGKSFVMGPSVRLAIYSFWEIIAFIINSLIFLLIGLKIPITLIIQNWYIIIIGVVAIIIGRAVAVYVILGIFTLLRKGLKISWMHVINWGGLHGSIPIALVLGLPLIDFKNEISIMVYGGVLFSLIIQGLTMSPLIKVLKIINKDKEDEKYEYYTAKIVALNQTLIEIKNMKKLGIISERKYLILNKELRKELKEVTNGLDISDKKFDEKIAETKLRLLKIKKNTYHDLAKQGTISDKTMNKLVMEIDRELTKASE